MAAGETAVPAGLALGDSPQVNREQLEPQDTLLFYSDGVVEARVEGEMFGEGRLVEAAERQFSGALPPAQTCRRLSAELPKGRSGRTTGEASLVLVKWLARSQQ